MPDPHDLLNLSNHRNVPITRYRRAPGATSERFVMSVRLKAVGHEWPDGRILFQSITASFESGRRYALVGPNGVGKSTLAAIAAGRLAPTAGAVESSGSMALLPQHETPPHTSVRAFLGDLRHARTLDERALRERLLEGVDRRRPCDALSGGEWSRVRLAKLLAEPASFFVLDEPTNQLDEAGRAALRAFLERTERGVLLVSHDRRLLEGVDIVLELSNLGLASYGGGWSFYRDQRDTERARWNAEARRLDRAAEAARRRATLDREAAERRAKRGAERARRVGRSRMEIGTFSAVAEASTGKRATWLRDSLERRREAVREQLRRRKESPRAYYSPPDTAVPAGKRIFEARGLNVRAHGAAAPLWSRPVDFAVTGPARVRLRGSNGTGKSTLLALVTGEAPPWGTVEGELRRGVVTARRLEQSLSALRGDGTVLQAAAAATGRSESALRDALARFLFAGDRVHQPIATLSGGERMRLALAQALLAHPVPELLVLDEPTNDLDVEHLEFLEGVLAGYRGALVVVTHDDAFAERLRLDTELDLEEHR
jgi:ATPase subunit of ABC transporter with duplicated ATPase domains